MDEDDSPASTRFVLYSTERDAYHATGGWTRDIGDAMTFPTSEAVTHYQRTRPQGRGTLILRAVVRLAPESLVYLDSLGIRRGELTDPPKPQTRRDGK